MPFPIERDEIAKTEKKLGCTFPESFIQKMIKNNGGEVQLIDPNDDGSCEESEGDDIWFIIPFFNSASVKLIKRTCNDIVSETMKAREYGLPQNAVAFAEDGCGNNLVFIIESNQCKNEIFLHNHESPNELIKIANDFSELIIP